MDLKAELLVLKAKVEEQELKIAKLEGTSVVQAMSTSLAGEGREQKCFQFLPSRLPPLVLPFQFCHLIPRTSIRTFRYIVADGNLAGSLTFTTQNKSLHVNR